MNGTITARFLRESLWTGVAAWFGMLLFVVLFVWAIHMMGPQLMEFLSSVEFLRQMLELAFGISLGGTPSSNVMFSIAWMHPVVLALAWGTLIAVATRQTAGEVERGTSELLLTLPVSRQCVLNSGMLTWSIVALLLSCSPLVGVLLGTRLFESHEPVQFGRFLIVLANFAALNLAVAGLATLAGVVTVRRGVAVAVVTGFLVAGVAMNFLESLLPVIRRLRVLNLLTWYRPSEIVRSGHWPVEDLLVLGGVLAVCLVAASVVWSRRDMPAP